MFIVRYIDVNRTINLKIDSKTLIITLVLGTVLGVAYYSGNRFFQLIMLASVLTYSIIANRGMIKAGGRLIRNFLKRK